MISAIAATRDRLTHSPIAARFLSGAAWSTAGTVASSGISLVTMMLVAHLLQKETYGQLIIVQSTLGMVGVFAGFGIGAAATRYVAELRSRDHERLARIIALTEGATITFGLIATVLMALTAGIISSKVLHSPGLTLPLLLASNSVLFSTIAAYQTSVLIGLEAMRAYATGTAVSAVASVPVILISAHMYGLNGVAGAMVLNAMILAGITRFQMIAQLKRVSIEREVHGCQREWRVLRDFAFPALLAGSLVASAHWLCQMMLANSPNGYDELAVLGVVMQWFNLILFLPSVAGRVVLPILTEHMSTKNHADAKRLILLAITANASVALPVAILVVLFSAWILQLYGEQFQTGSVSMIIGVITAALLAVQAPVGNMVAALSRMWLGALMNFGWAIVYVGFAYLLLNHGSAGITAAMGIAYLVHAVWTFVFVYSQTTSDGESIIA